jgi:putative DNA-invertase from lambdoid prophage Rac
LGGRNVPQIEPRPEPEPSFTRAQFEAVRQVLSREKTLSQIAKSAGLTRQTVYRIKDNPSSCEAALAAWGL